MKHALFSICLLFLLSATASAQFAKGTWEIGSSFFAGRSWLYNYNDWHPLPEIFTSPAPNGGVRIDTVVGDDIFPVSPNPFIKPNSISNSIFAGYNWGQYHGIEIQVIFSSVKQSFIYNRYYWGSSKQTEDLQLHYINLPISYTLYTSNRYRFQGFVGVGMEPGFLVNYKGERFNFIPYFIPTGKEEIEHTIYHNNSRLIHFLGESKQNKIDFVYKRLYLGTTINLGFRQSLSKNIGFSFMVRGSTSLINPENHEARNYYDADNPSYMWTKHGRYIGGGMDAPPKDRAHTYILRVGAEMRLFYRLHAQEYVRRLKKQ